MSLEIPELLEPYAADVYNIVALRYGCLGVGPVEEGAERNDVSHERFVHGEEAEILDSDFGRGGERFGKVLLVGRNGLGVEVGDFEEEDGDAALVAPAEPLRILSRVRQLQLQPAAQKWLVYQTARLLELFRLDSDEQIVDVVLLAPVFRVLELLEGFWRDEAARAQEAPWGNISTPPSHYWSEPYNSVSSSWLGCVRPSVPAGV